MTGATTAGAKQVQRVADSAFLSHLLRAGQRYTNRMGNQLAASVAFYTMLAMVPLLMLACAACGFVITVSRPELLGRVQDFVVGNLHIGPLQTQVLRIVNNYLYNWQNVGLIGFWVALFLGANWVASLKQAIKAMSRLDFNVVSSRRSAAVNFLIDIFLLVAFLVLSVLTFLAIAIATQLAGRVVTLLSPAQGWVSAGLIQGASYLLSLLSATALLYLVFRFFIPEKIATLVVIRGALAAGLCWVGLQIIASHLIVLFTLSETTQIFGPVIVVVLLIRLFAQITLFWTAWIATSNQPAIPRRYSLADQILQDQEGTLTVEDHWSEAEADRQGILHSRDRKRIFGNATDDSQFPASS